MWNSKEASRVQESTCVPLRVYCGPRNRIEKLNMGSVVVAGMQAPCNVRAVALAFPAGGGSGVEHFEFEVHSSHAGLSSGSWLGRSNQLLLCRDLRGRSPTEPVGIFSPRLQRTPSSTRDSWPPPLQLLLSLLASPKPLLPGLWRFLHCHLSSLSLEVQLLYRTPVVVLRHLRCITLNSWWPPKVPRCWINPLSAASSLS